MISISFKPKKWHHQKIKCKIKQFNIVTEDQKKESDIKRAEKIRRIFDKIKE
jgi:hypothetical protein